MTRVRVAARWLAVAIVLLTLLGDFLSPSAPGTPDLRQFYAPPTRIHWVDGQGRFHWRPFVHGRELIDSLDVRYQEQHDRLFPIRLFSSGYGYKFLGIIPASRHLLTVDSPGSFHPLGTDALGRDVFARSMAGAKTTLLVLLVGIVIYFAIGVGFGAVAGMLEGWPDTILMRVSEFVLALPALYLVLALRTLIPPDMPFWQIVILTSATIASVAWPPLARGVRGLILQNSHAAYADASKLLGASRWHLFRRHLAPAMLPYALAQTVAAAPVFILGEVALSFLNVGFQGSGTSWGAMLRPLAEDPRILTDFWWNLAPLALVFITLFCTACLGERFPRRVPAQLA